MAQDDKGGTDAEAAEVLDFWFGAPGSPERGTLRKIWFAKNAAFDAGIARRFAPLIERGLRGELVGWRTDAHRALAEIVLLDQFTRNAFRDTPRAFAGDPQALSAASAMVGKRLDEQLPTTMRLFVYLPFEHAESEVSQAESVRLVTRLAEQDTRLLETKAYAEKHRDIVARFGRFPHRNAILGRLSTTEELSFLQTPGSRF